ncbi:hypothetical protein M9Y10_037896 [Tritrichomonas musculus]|uniref:DUF3447 domain-containing protein n=1 Tax=Tritrichomonas musculus TaxID=1915356 RepID=A0ABR2K7T4_9EUKA
MNTDLKEKIQKATEDLNNNLNEFPFDDALKILIEDLPNQDLFIPRINLYFSIAKKKPDLPILHSSFESIVITPMYTPQFSLDALKSLEEFIEIKSSFFTFHATLLLNKLLTISLNKEIGNIEIRKRAIFCIRSIAVHSPEICKSMKNFYKNYVSKLVLIVSEISEKDPLDYKENDESLSMQALYSIKAIDESLRNQDGFNTVYQIYKSILDPEEPQDNWQSKYALISSLTNMINSSSKIQNVLPLCKSFIPFLDLKTQPHIRMAIYKFIEEACKLIRDVTVIQDIINRIFQLAFEEEKLKEDAFQTLITFFSIPTAQMKNEIIYKSFFNDYFSRLVDELRERPIKEYIIQCIGYIARDIKNLYEPFYVSTTECFWSLLQEKNDLSLDVAIIHSLAISLTNIAIPRKLRTIRTVCAYFWQKAISLKKNDIKEEYIQKLDDAISILSRKLGADESELRQMKGGKKLNVTKTWLEDDVFPLLLDLCEENAFWVRKEITSSVYFNGLVRDQNNDKLLEILEKILIIRPSKWEVLSCFCEDISDLLPLDLPESIESAFSISENDDIQAIMVDDLEYFLNRPNENLIDISEFPNKEYYFIKDCDKICDKENYEKSDKIPILLLSALFGSESIFHYFLEQGDLVKIKSDIGKYLVRASIIGGNHRIIMTLKKLDLQFDKCLNLSVIFHRNDIFIWILNQYKLKIEKEPFLKFAEEHLNFELLAQLDITENDNNNVSNISPKKIRARQRK